MARAKGRGDSLTARVSAPTPTRGLKTIHVFLVVLTLAVLAYANSLRNAFVFDDNLLITQAREVLDLASAPGPFAQRLRQSSSLPADQRITHRPVRTVAMAIEYYLFGRNPEGYRAVSIFLHALNGALVFMILRAVVNRPWPALLAAALFTVHPIQTESVAYIAGQRDLLFALFYLLGFLSYLRYRATARAGALALGALAYLLGLLTKEMAITLPLLCVTYDLFRAVPGPGPGIASPSGEALRRGLHSILTRSKWLYLGMGGLLAAFLLYFAVVANPSQQRTWYGGGLGPTLMTSARILVYYLKQMVFPVILNADSYGAFTVSRSIADPRGLLALLILGGLCYGLFRGLRIDRWITFGGMWFFLTLLPVSQLIPHQELVAEHFLYLPSVGFCLVVSLVVERGLVARRAAPAMATLFVLSLAVLLARTIARNRDWRDELTLWTKSVQAAPHSYWARQRLGDAYKALGRYEEAIQEYRTVQTLTPGFPTEFIAIGDALRRMGRHEEAADHFRRALTASPTSVAARLGLAQAYLAMGLVERAREIHASVARYVAKAADDFRATGDAKRARGLPAEAIQAYRNGLELNPFDPALHFGLGEAYAALGQHVEATAAYGQALQLDPTYGPAKGRLDASGQTVAPAAFPVR